MRFRCINGICVLQRLESRRQIGSIILPDSAQKKSELARVLECCPAWREDGADRETILRVGDVVCISKYDGQEFEIGGEAGDLNIVLVKESRILCVLEDFDAPPATAKTPDVPLGFPASPIAAPTFVDVPPASPTEEIVPFRLPPQLTAGEPGLRANGMPETHPAMKFLRRFGRK